MSGSEYEGPVIGVVNRPALGSVMDTFFRAWGEHQRVHPVLGVCDTREPDEECCDRMAVRAVLTSVGVHWSD